MVLFRWVLLYVWLVVMALECGDWRQVARAVMMPVLFFPLLAVAGTCCGCVGEWLFWGALGPDAVARAEMNPVLTS